MTERDELSRLARAITEAEDDLNTSNHRNDCEQLAAMDAERSALIERVDARELALTIARDGLQRYAVSLSSAGAEKVEIETANDINTWLVAEPAEPYSNGLDGHQED